MHRLLPFVVLLASLSLGGCLMVEKKEYLFLVRPDGSGQARITFENISSAQESDADGDHATKDYTKLLTEYVKGRRFESDNPAFYNVKKRLYEEDGKLYGEVTFDFLSYEDVGLFRLEGAGPWMYHTAGRGGATVEKFESSNGTFGGASMPVVFWKDETTEFKIRTIVEEAEKGTSRSLLPLYKRIGVN
jgi:hypothetical protein